MLFVCFFVFGMVAMPVCAEIATRGSKNVITRASSELDSLVAAARVEVVERHGSALAIPINEVFSRILRFIVRFISLLVGR